MAAAARAKPITRSTASVVKPRPRPAAKPRPRSRTAAPKRRPAPGAKRHTPVTGFAAVPAAVGVTAHAVGGLADSRLVHRLTSGRGWIFILGTLLSGIVAMNLYALSFSAGSAGKAAEADALAQSNSVLQSRIAKLLSSAQVTGSAAAMGLTLPPPDAVSYLSADSDAAARAAERLTNGEIIVGGVAIPASETDPVTAPATTEPVAEPVTEVPAEPVATEPTTTEPATEVVVTDQTAGGVAP